MLFGGGVTPMSPSAVAATTTVAAGAAAEVLGVPSAGVVAVVVAVAAEAAANLGRAVLVVAAACDLGRERLEHVVEARFGDRPAPRVGLRAPAVVQRLAHCRLLAAW